MSRILVVSHTPTHPANSGNRARVNSLLSVLREAGHQICFFFIDLGDGDNSAMGNAWDCFWPFPYQLPDASMGKRALDLLSNKLRLGLYLPYGVDDWYQEILDKELQALKSRMDFDAVLVEYVFFSKALKVFPESLKILDTHDIFGDRHKLFLKHGKRPTWYFTTSAQEAKGINRADCVLAIQEREREYFTKLAPARNILRVGHVVPIVPPGAEKTFNNRLLFIGSANDVNFHSLSFFFDEVWPLVSSLLPSLEMDVVGDICRRFPTFPAGCRAIGPVDDLENCYFQADIVVNPVRFGTGLKIKNVEALGFGMPLVTTAVGAEGIEEGIGSAFSVANEPEEFASEVYRLITDEKAREKFSRTGLDFARSYNSRAAKELLDLLEK